MVVVVAGATAQLQAQVEMDMVAVVVHLMEYLIFQVETARVGMVQVAAAVLELELPVMAVQVVEEL